MSFCLARRAPQFILRVVGKKCARNDNRVVSPSRSTVIRVVAHISPEGDVPRMSQHLIVISGTSTPTSIHVTALRLLATTNGL